MPYKRKYQKKKKKSANVNKGTVVSLNSQPFPSSMITKHRYVTTVTLDAGAGAPDTLYFNCLGLFDPEAAVGGHQPLGFDQMTPIYDHYTVLGSKITVRAIASGVTPSEGHAIGIYVNDDASGSTTYNTVQEQGNGVVKLLSPLQSGNGITMSKTFSTKNYFGVADIMDNDRLYGTQSTNPSETAYYAVFAQSISSASNPGVVYCNVQIDYITKWSERKSLIQS